MREVVRGDKHNLRKSANCNAQISVIHSAHCTDWCVAICRFSQVNCVCHLEQLHAQSPFLFPIVFSINLIPFFDICSVDYLLFFHPGCSGMCCFTWAAAWSQQYTLLFVVLAAGIFVIRCGLPRSRRFGRLIMNGSRAPELECHAQMEHAKMLVERVLTRCSIFLAWSMSTKWYWVNHGRLTSESKASASHRHSSITRPCCSSAQAPSAPSFLSLQSCTRTLDRLWTRRRAKLLVFTERVTIMHWNTRQALNASTRQASCLYWTRQSLPSATHRHSRCYWWKHDIFFKRQEDRQNGEYKTRKKSRGQIEKTFRPGASSVAEASATDEVPGQNVFSICPLLFFLVLSYIHHSVYLLVS